MKIFWLFSLVILSLCTCQSDKTITPDYDGEYPYNKRTGQYIPTYQSTFISSWKIPPAVPVATPVPATGQYSFMFKDHTWNHWPYIYISLIKYTKTPSAYEYIDGPVFGASFVAHSGYGCNAENIDFAVSAKAGRYRFGQEIVYNDLNPSFQDIACDFAVDRIVLNKSADNWVKITRLDTIANQAEGSFDLSFKIIRKDTTYSIIYPTNIHMRGSFNGPFQKR